MKKSKLLTKQLVIAKYNLILKSNFLIFLNDELVKFFLLKTTIKKIQKWVYKFSNIGIESLQQKFTTFPIKVIVLNKGQDSFDIITNLNIPLKFLLVKWINLYIKVTRFFFGYFYYFFSFNILRNTLFFLTKLFWLKKCIFS